MMLHRLFLAFIFASLTFLPLSFSYADDYGPFLPPSVAKEKQVAKQPLSALSHISPLPPKLPI